MASFLCSICLGLISTPVFAIVIIWSFPFPTHSACNTHCRSCDSQASCTSCQDPNKVLLSGECQFESCAPQYYLDLSTKACKGKALPESYNVFLLSDARPIYCRCSIPYMGKTLIISLHFLS